MDEEYIEILDNKLEEDLLKEYQDFFVKQLKNQPEMQMVLINDWLRARLAKDYKGHTVVGHEKEA